MSLLFKNLRAAFAAHFNEFEQLLLQPYGTDRHFLKYLAEYRGVGVMPVQIPEDALPIAEKIVTLFKDVCGDAFQILNGIAVTDSEQALEDFESRVNLSLLYWYGINDKNYQFRTLVHYFDWEGLSGNLFTYDGQQFCLTFFTDGIRIAPEGSERAPQTASLLDATGGSEGIHFEHEKNYFARLRTIQNQLIFLVDTWEYRNTVLAVEQGEARDLAKRNNDDDFYKNALDHIETSRNQLATYTMKCFADFEHWLAATHTLATKPETRDEWDATHALLLSGLQKVFLPGSISRHKFSETVVDQLARWVVARKINAPHDLSTLFVEALCDLILKKQANPTPIFLKVDAKQSLDWGLSFDPCTALKAFSWSYAFSNQRIFCLLLIVALSKKMMPEALDRYWLETIASVVQMPSTFSSSSPSTHGLLLLDSSHCERLTVLATAALAAVASDDEITPLIHFLKQELELHS